MLCKWKKEEDMFGVDGLGGKVICYLGENFKLGVLWLENMGVEWGEILVFILGLIYGVEGGFYS